MGQPSPSKRGGEEGQSCSSEGPYTLEDHGLVVIPCGRRRRRRVLEKNKKASCIEINGGTTIAQKSHVGRGGGKGTVTPLLKGKVRIPPPAGHSIDPPLVKEILFFDPPFVKKKIFLGIDKNHQKFASKMQNYIFLEKN